MSAADDPDLLRSRRSPRAPRRAAGGRAENAQTSVNALILLLYTISIVWPIKFQIGPAYMTVSRMMIIALLVPMALRVMSGTYGGIKRPDYFILLYCLWAFIALSANHGVGNVLEFSVMFFVETAGAYLIGRVFIRNQDDFYCFVKYLLIAVACAVPFVMVEMLTGNPTIIEFLRKVNPAPEFFKLPPTNNYEPRMGLYRSQFTFVHPILFGVFCASLMALALTVRTYAQSTPHKVFWGMIVGIGTFASLSSGALLSAMLQLSLLVFERVTRAIKSRWKLLSITLVVLYFTLDLLSNRSPVELFISVFTFNQATSFNRLLIWEYGSAEVWRHPVFGIGNNDWVRPEWMVPSIDNQWLLQTMRYGIPGGFFLIFSVLWVLFKVGKVDMSNNHRLQLLQRGYLSCMIAWCIALGTVAINVEVASYFMTLLAAGIWMLDVTPDETAAQEQENDTGRGGTMRRRAKPQRSKPSREAIPRRKPPKRGLRQGDPKDRQGRLR